MSRKKRNQHSPTERIGKDRAAEKESKKDSEQEGGRNRCVFGWVSNKELGGAAITPLKAAAHALHRSSRQSTQPSRLLPSQSPRCILIDCNCQLTVCSSSGYCTLTFIIFLVLFQRLSWDQQFFLFHYKKKKNPDCSVTLLALREFSAHNLASIQPMWVQKKVYIALTFGWGIKHFFSLSVWSMITWLNFETAAC